MGVFEIPAEHRGGYATGQRPPLADDELAIRWLGTAGYELRTTTDTLLIDPYLSRSRLPEVVTRELVADEDACAVVDRATAIACGHSHFDHLLDTPHLAKRLGATVLGSPSTCEVARAFGVPDDRVAAVADDRSAHRYGAFEVRFVPSRHGRILGWRPFKGPIRRPVDLPLRVHQYRMGGAYGIWIRVGDLTLYHNGSADLIDDELDGLEADVLFLGLAGRQGTHRYLERMVGHLGPRLILPTHYDWFFRPLADGIRLLPLVRMQSFLEQARVVAPDARVVMAGFLEETRLPLSGYRVTEAPPPRILVGSSAARG